MKGSAWNERADALGPAHVRAHVRLHLKPPHALVMLRGHVRLPLLPCTATGPCCGPLRGRLQAAAAVQATGRIFTCIKLVGVLSPSLINPGLAAPPCPSLAPGVQCVGPRSMGRDFVTWDKALEANGHTDVHILKIDIEGKKEGGRNGCSGGATSP